MWLRLFESRHLCRYGCYAVSPGLQHYCDFGALSNQHHIYGTQLTCQQSGLFSLLLATSHNLIRATWALMQFTRFLLFVSFSASPACFRSQRAPSLRILSVLSCLSLCVLVFSVQTCEALTTHNSSSCFFQFRVSVVRVAVA